jgi:hypothetical protein
VSAASKKLIRSSSKQEASGAREYSTQELVSEGVGSERESSEKQI